MSMEVDSVDDMDLSRKRPNPDDGESNGQSQSKRQRTGDLESRPDTPVCPTLTGKDAYEVVRYPTAESFGRDGLRRAIVVALKHVGFESATNEALEGFTDAVDTYLSDFVGHLRRTANAARRNNPVPEDFALILREHNVALSALKPHLKNPVPKDQLTPSYFDPVAEDISHLLKPRPYLGEELSGRKEKEARPWIPKNLPEFPSAYTYKFTPVHESPDIEKEQTQAETDAKKAELALRRINRAARISRQKDVKIMAQRNAYSKERHELWEKSMAATLPREGAGASVGEAEIADHSSIVNFGLKYGRSGVPKARSRIQSQGQADPFKDIQGM